MRSLPHSDTWLGLAVAAGLVAAAGWAAVVIDRHAEQHGHCAPLAMIDVEGAQRLQRDAGGQGVGGFHACSIHLLSAGKNVRGGRP